MGESLPGVQDNLNPQTADANVKSRPTFQNSVNRLGPSLCLSCWTARGTGHVPLPG